MNTASINDRLGPGGLESVAILEKDASGNTVLVGAGGRAIPVADAIPLLDHRQPNGGRGTVICDWSIGADGTASTTDVWPEPVYPTPPVPQVNGAAAKYYAQANTTGQSSDFNAIGFWAKGSVRADGEAYTSIEVGLGVTTTFVDRMYATASVRADGKWRFLVIYPSQFGVNGTFTKGTTTFDYVRMLEKGQATTLTFAAAPSSGATGATLSAAFGGTTGLYRTRFSSDEVRLVALTNGSTAATWGDALTATATTSAIYTIDRLQAKTGDLVAFGPVYRNPAAKAFAFIRFDDNCADQYTPRITLATDYVGTSGVTIPASTPLSALSILESFGLKASCFILTNSPGKTSNFMTWGQLRTLQDTYGWTIGFQSHADPIAIEGGLRLLGPFGYNYTQVYGSIASVDTAANTITTAAAHNITQTTGVLGEQGFPVAFYGTDLPSPLVAGTQYWLRNTSTTAFTVHATELDAVGNTKAIDLITTGTVANFNFRYWGSSNDKSAIRADFDTGQALMQSHGLYGWKHYAMNQGAWDSVTEEVILDLIDEGSIASVSAILGSSGVLTGATYIPRVAIGEITGGHGSTANKSQQCSIGNWITIPVSIGTEGASEDTVRAAIKNACNRGHIISFYHHAFSSEANCRQFIAACDEIKLRSDQGLLEHGTVEDLWDRLNDTAV